MDDPITLMRELASRQPRFCSTVAADARVTAAYRSERAEFRSKLDTVGQILRLMWVSDAFAAHVLYRAKARMQALGVPVLPRIAHRPAMAIGQVAIGDPVLMHPGVYIVHGQVVLDGIVEIHPDVSIAPWVTIGLKAGNFRGPTIGAGVAIGTGAKIIGPVTVGA